MEFLASLLKLFGRARATGAGLVEPTGFALPACEPVPAVAAIQAAGVDPQSADVVSCGQLQTHPVSGRFDANVDRRFTACLLGVGPLRPAQAEAAERRVVEHLEQLASDSRNSNLVPRLPVVLPRLISATSPTCKRP